MAQIQATTTEPAIATPPQARADSHQQHPIKLYLLVWGLLFVFSVGSYMVDYLALQGMLRWSLIIILMLLKAGLIIAVFMHMAWERLALVYAILTPPLLVLAFAVTMAFESRYTEWMRLFFFGGN